MKRLTLLGEEELVHESKELGSPFELVAWVAKHGKLPVPNFSAGGIATPADAALVMQLGRGGGVRWFGDFQVERSGGSGARDCEGDYAL